jgi:hypothetical protein
VVNEIKVKFVSILNEVPGHEDKWGIGGQGDVQKKKRSSLSLPRIEPRCLSCPTHITVTVLTSAIPLRLQKKKKKKNKEKKQEKYYIFMNI